MPDVSDGDWDRGGAAGRKSHRYPHIRRMLSLDEERPRVEVGEDHVLSILCARRAREAILGRGLFSDPAWDIMLELYAARLGKRKITVGEVARSIGTPQSTTARWITVLTERQLVVVVSQAAETVELWVELSRAGEAAMKRLVDYWGSAFRSI